MYKVCNCFFLKKNKNKNNYSLNIYFQLGHCATALRVGDKLRWGGGRSTLGRDTDSSKCQEPVLCDDLFPGLSNILKMNWPTRAYAFG